MVWSSTPVCGRSNCAFTRASALSARSGRSCSTAIISPSLTTRAPAFSAALVSAPFNCAPCAGGRTRRACSMPGKHEIAGVLRLAGDFIERVLARRRVTDNRVRGDRFDRDVLHVPLDALALHQLPVGHALAGRVGIGHHAGLHVQPGGGRLQLLARHLQQDGFRLGARAAQRRTEIAHVHGAEGAHVVGAQFGIAQNHVHRVVRHVEFFGEDLCQHGHRALPQFHLAGKAGDPPIGADPQVGVEVGRVSLPGRQARGFLRGERTDTETEEQAGTGHRQQFAAAQAGSGGFRAIGRFHSAPPLGAPAASWMASTIRTCAPQRHRLSSMWRAICSGVGLGVLSSSA